MPQCAAVASKEAWVAAEAVGVVATGVVVRAEVRVEGATTEGEAQSVVGMGSTRPCRDTRAPH
eukprot:4151515-Prymnesium_polylepis.1